MPPTTPELAQKLMQLHANSDGAAGVAPGSPPEQVVQAVDNLMKDILDSSKPAKARAEHLLLFVNEVGYDVLAHVTELLARVDAYGELEKKVAELAAKAEAAEKKPRPLRPEIYVRNLKLADGPAHVLQTEGGAVVLPADPTAQEELGDLRCGDCVLVDAESGTIVARDGQICPTGDIVTVEEVPEDDADLHAVVRIRDERSTAHVADSVRRDPGFKAGARVVYDSRRQFLHRVLEDRADGTDLLTPASELSGFGLDSLGAPHPVLDKLLRLVKRMVKHPKWVRKMKARGRCSYLFWGPTGTGKTCTIKVFVNLVADWLEELTGVREPRVVFCDASDFYSPYFGEAEIKISHWFEKLGRVARVEFVTRSGKRIKAPLIVVLEEIEGLLRQRGEHSASSHLFDRVLSLILQKMDDVRNDLDVPILVLSTTNMKSLVDTAGKRRFGQREARFDMLTAEASLAVLEKKIPTDIAVCVLDGETEESSRQRLLAEVVYWLFGDQEDQVIARASTRDGRTLEVRRRDIVSGAILEMAVSQAIDECLDRSEEAGELLGLDAEGVIGALEEQFDSLASSFGPHNLREYLPRLLEGGTSPDVTHVEVIRYP